VFPAPQRFDTAKTLTGHSGTLSRPSGSRRPGGADKPMNRCCRRTGSGNPPSDHAGALLHEPGKCGSTCTFCDIVRILEIGPHRFSNLVLA